jgi:hypothetical protein
MTLNCQRGETVGDDDGKITRAGSKLHDGIRVERSAEIRLAEIRGSIRGVAVKLKDRYRRFSKNWEFVAESFGKGGKVQRGMDRVACLSVRKLKIEYFTRGNTVPSDRQRHAGRRKVPEIQMSSWDE